MTLPLAVAVGTGITTHLPLVSDGVAVLLELGSGLIRIFVTLMTKFCSDAADMPVRFAMNSAWTWPAVAAAVGLELPPLLHAAGPKQTAQKSKMGARSERAAHENRNLFTSRPWGENFFAQNGVAESTREGNQSPQ